jgi:hypothetical protein
LDLVAGDEVLARWLHPFGGKKWYPGVVSAVHGDTADIKYHDNMFEGYDMS